MIIILNELLKHILFALTEPSITLNRWKHSGKLRGWLKDLNKSRKIKKMTRLKRRTMVMEVEMEVKMAR